MITDEANEGVSVSINFRDLVGKESFLAFNNITRELHLDNLNEQAVGEYDLRVEIVDKSTNKLFQITMELKVAEMKKDYSIYKNKALCMNVAQTPIGRFDSPNLCSA